MQSGVVYGYTALVDGMVDRIEAELGEKSNVVATGGLSGVMITPLVVHDPSTTSRGSPSTGCASSTRRTNERRTTPDLRRPASRVDVTDRRPTCGAPTPTCRTAASTGVDRRRVAGRIMLLRGMGRLAFATLRDGSGAIQLFATEGDGRLRRAS